MMKKILILIGIWSVGQRGLAQTGDYVGIQFPISALNYYYSYLSVEYDKCIDPRWRLNTHFDYIIPFSPWTDGSYRDSIVDLLKKRDGRGFCIGIEPRFFFTDLRDYTQINHFIGADISFARYKYNSTQELLNPNPYQTHSFNVGNQIWSGQIVYGTTISEKERLGGIRLLLSMSVGLGMRYIRIDNDLTIPYSDFIDGRRWSQSIQPEEKGRYWRFMASFEYNIFIYRTKKR